MAPAAIVLAAGAGTRMRGADKLLNEIDGAPLLARVITLAGTFCAPVFTALPPHAPERHAIVTGLGAVPVPVANHRDGMGASLAAAARQMGENVDSVLVFLGDMPDLTPADVEKMLLVAERAPGAWILRGADGAGCAGHPVMFRKPLFEALTRLTGDRGARDLIAAHHDRLCFVPLSGAHARTDLDTPEDWAKWRAERQSP